jgi:hypothetical protein
MYYIYSFMNGVFLRVQGALSLLERKEAYIATLYDMDETIKNTLTWEVNLTRRVTNTRILLIP